MNSGKRKIMLIVGATLPTSLTDHFKDEGIEYITVTKDGEPVERGITLNMVTPIEAFSSDIEIESNPKFYDKLNHKGGKKNKRNKKW